MTANPEPPRGRIPADTFSNRLLLARKLAGMTIEEAAEAIGATKSSWANWENGRRPHGQVEICQAIAEALDIDRDWLLFGGPLAPSVRPSKMRKPSGGATVRKPPAPIGPRDTRPQRRTDPGGPNGGRGPGVPRGSADRRRPVRISAPVAA